MLDIEKQLREIMQENDPSEVEKSIAITTQLSIQYRQQCGELFNGIKKNAALGFALISLTFTPILANYLSGDYRYLFFCLASPIPFTMGLRQFYYAFSALPSLVDYAYKLDDAESMKDFLIRTRK